MLDLSSLADLSQSLCQETLENYRKSMEEIREQEQERENGGE